MLCFFQALLLELMCSPDALLLSFEGAKLSTFSPIQAALPQLLLQLFASILRGFLGCVRLSLKALLDFVLTALRALLDSLLPGLRTIRHSVPLLGRTLLSAVLNALLTLLHALLDWFLPLGDTGGGRRCLALRRGSRPLRRRRGTHCRSGSRHSGRRRRT